MHQGSPPGRGPDVAVRGETLLSVRHRYIMSYISGNTYRMKVRVPGGGMGSSGEVPA